MLRVSLHRRYSIGTSVSGDERKQSGDRQERLLLAVEAGQAGGGDRRGRESAALVTAPFGPDPYSAINIRVDQHEQPVAELRRIADSLAGRYKEAAAEAQRLETGG